jgi:hypothetical protein
MTDQFTTTFNATSALTTPRRKHQKPTGNRGNRVHPAAEDTIEQQQQQTRKIVSGEERKAKPKTNAAGAATPQSTEHQQRKARMCTREHRQRSSTDAGVPILQDDG